MRSVNNSKIPQRIEISSEVHTLSIIRRETHSPSLRIPFWAKISYNLWRTCFWLCLYKGIMTFKPLLAQDLQLNVVFMPQPPFWKHSPEIHVSCIYSNSFEAGLYAITSLGNFLWLSKWVFIWLLTNMRQFMWIQIIYKSLMKNCRFVVRGRIREECN